MDIEARIKKIIVEKLGVIEKEILPESTFKDLGADSLDAVDLIMAFEEEFDIKVPDSEAEKMTTIADVICYFEIHS